MSKIRLAVRRLKSEIVSVWDFLIKMSDYFRNQ